MITIRFGWIALFHVVKDFNYVCKLFCRVIGMGIKMASDNKTDSENFSSKLEKAVP